MKALCEVIVLKVSDVVTASGNDCEIYSGGSNVACEGDDDC